MTKLAELTESTSCLSIAKANELIFVLLARDAAAPAAIRAWCAERVRLGRNSPSDLQILDALKIADEMEATRETFAKRDNETVPPGTHWVSLSTPEGKAALHRIVQQANASHESDPPPQEPKG